MSRVNMTNDPRHLVVLFRVSQFSYLNKGDIHRFNLITPEFNSTDN